MAAGLPRGAAAIVLEEVLEALLEDHLQSEAAPGSATQSGARPSVIRASIIVRDR